jgi:hypothetical protein
VADNLTGDYRDYCIFRAYTVYCDHDPLDRKLCKDKQCKADRQTIIKLYRKEYEKLGFWRGTVDKKIKEVFNG